MPSIGIKSPAKALGYAIDFVRAIIKVSGSTPGASVFASNVLIPPKNGVPTAPKGTGTVLKIRTTKAAAKGGNPNPTNNGPAKAAGVTKPAAPSIKPPNIEQIIMACTHLSVVIPLNPLLIVAMTPESLMVFKIKIAPKMIT